MWTDLYKPTRLQDLVGNDGLVNSLFSWLKDWDNVHVRGIKKEVPKFGNFNKGAFSTGNANSKSVLVSGPPGIGKTSAVRIVCKHLGYEVLEMNASDCRSKTAITSSLTTLSGNKSIDYWTKSGLAK